MPQKNKIPFLNQKFDPRTFFTIFKRNFWVIVIIGVVSVGAGLAYYRYTLPVFKATSILQIKNENKTNQILGINSVVMENDLAPVIELIRSHEFLKTVVAALPLEISYYRQGTFLSTELYGSTPFEIKYRLNNPVILDQKIICEFKDYKCILSYEINGEMYEYTINPEEWQPIYGMEILIHFPTKKDMEIELDPDNKSQYYFTINDPNTVLYRISANLNIQILNETAGTILITYYDYNASKAAAITNTIAEKFIQFDENKKKESANNIVNYIDQQMENVFSQLNATEQDLHDFRVQNNIRSTTDNVLFNKANIYTAKISELENKLISVDFEIMTLEKISDKIKTEPELKTYEILAMLAGQQSEIFLTEMINSLQELFDRKEVLLFDVTSNNHKIRVIDEQIQSKKDILVDFVNSTIIRLNGEKTEYEKRINEIESQVFVDSSYDEIEYARLLRLYSINEDFYSQLIQTKAETMISQAGYVSANLILEKASVPAYPDYPALRKVFILSVIIAFVISVMFILLKYLLYNKILSTLDISEFTDIPVIGGIPEVKIDMPVSQVIVHKRPKSMITEAFRSIRNNLDFYPIKEKCRVVTVSSTIAGEGKTFIALNIAAIYAMTGKKVLIMDFDLRKPRLDKCFSVSNLKGISTILIQKHSYEECLHNSEIENLQFITSGPLPPNPAELILGQNLVNLVEEVKKAFDIVIIDTPPIGIVTDALVTYKLAHNPIYVMRAAISPKSFISNVDNFVQDTQITKIGIILNGIERSTSRYGYGYKSGYGYQYGYRSYGYGYGYLTKVHNSYYGEEVETKYLIFNRLIKKLKKIKK